MNFFSDIPKDIPKEIIETILSSKNIRIERIISGNNTSSKEFWY